MTVAAENLPVGIHACDCLTAFGDAQATASALVAGRIALQLRPALGQAGGDPVPLALLEDMDETLPPRWLRTAASFARRAPGQQWGSARRPVIVTSSNFGVGSLYAFTQDNDARHLMHGTPAASVELLRRELGWGENVQVFSHACVTAHLGLLQAARVLHAGLADEVLVFTFDLLSPFVVGGFNSLKILNGAMPAPFQRRDIGAIGMGDGLGFVVLRREEADFNITTQALFNEMYHFTSNRPDGAGFDACLSAIAPAVEGRRIWVKGHGTGTLEAGRLEAEAVARTFGPAPLVSWKGSLGHTLGSCGLVELAIALAALREGVIPGTVGSEGPCFTESVALAPFAAAGFDAAVLSSNAFGGAHAALVLEPA